MDEQRMGAAEQPKTTNQPQAAPPRDFEEFWPYYLREHAKPGTRAAHLLATGTALAGVAGAAALRSKRMLAAGIGGGYGIAWTSHALIEDNKPATFTNPLWSLRADMRMFRLWLTGALNAELAKAGIEVPPPKQRPSARDRRRRAVIGERLKRREEKLDERRKLVKEARKRREKSLKSA